MFFLKKMEKFKHRITHLLSKCKKHRHLDIESLLESSEQIPYFSLKGKLKSNAKITKIINNTDLNACLNYQGAITKFGIRLYGLEQYPELKIDLHDFVSENKLMFLVAHDFDLDGKLLVTLYCSEQLYNIGDMSINEQILLRNNIDGFINDVDPFFEIIL